MTSQYVFIIAIGSCKPFTPEKNDVIYERSPSATLGMGHMEQQKQLSYDTASLGAGAGQSSGHAPAAPPTSQSCTHLAEVGRSRSDLGYTRPPGPHPPPMMSPKKPPRMYQYGASQASSRRKSMAETHTVNIPISKTQSHGVL